VQVGLRLQCRFISSRSIVPFDRGRTRLGFFLMLYWDWMGERRFRILFLRLVYWSQYSLYDSPPHRRSNGLQRLFSSKFQVIFRIHNCESLKSTHESIREILILKLY